MLNNLVAPTKILILMAFQSTVDDHRSLKLSVEGPKLHANDESLNSQCFVLISLSVLLHRRIKTWFIVPHWQCIGCVWPSHISTVNKQYIGCVWPSHISTVNKMCIDVAFVAAVTTYRPCGTWPCWLQSHACWSPWMWTPWSLAMPS